MKGKVLILSVADIRHMSMISLYTELLEKNGVEYDVICSDRYGKIPEYIKGRIYAIPLYTNNLSRIKKVIPFLRFKRLANNIIKTKDYSFIVVWGENAAVLFSDILNQFKYCINIRDIDFPNRIYRSILHKIALKADFCTIPIDHEISVLKGTNWIPVISINDKIIQKCEIRDGFRKRDQIIRISFIGKVRFLDTAEEIIQAFGNDQRYQLQFFGVGADGLEEIIRNNNVRNVVLSGEFSPEDTYEYLNRSDIIDACYGDGAINDIFKYALPIKFGYAPSLKIPVLVSPNTYMENIVKKYGFGFTFVFHDHIADELYDWYCKQDFESFNRSCDRYISNCKAYNKKFEELFLGACR